MSLDMWQGAEQEFAAGSNPIKLYSALADKGVYVFQPLDNIPRAILRNGGVCYIHSNLFEVSTPECRNTLELVTQEKACEAYARLASWALEELTGETVHLYKANIASDPLGKVKYTTVGAHENYLVRRKPYLDNVDLTIPYLVLREVLFGTGGYVDDSFMISPRAIFPLKVLSETSTDYPIVSTRDEPHAGDDQFRVHIVHGEGARSDYITFLKYGFTSYVLQAIQEGYITHIPELVDPIQTGLEISQNLEGDWSIKLSNGTKSGVAEYLINHYLDGVERLFSEKTPQNHDNMVLREIKWILGKLDEGLLEALDYTLEWRVKLNLIERDIHDHFVVDDSMDEISVKKAAAHQYTAVTDPLFDVIVEEKDLKTVVSEEDIEWAFMNPPVDSRACFRVASAKLYRESLDSMNWSYLKIRKGVKTIPFHFPSLDGWNEIKQKKMLGEVEKLIFS